MNVRPRLLLQKSMEKLSEIAVNKDQKKDQSYVKVGKIVVHYIKERKLWVRLAKVSAVSRV